jgi:neuropeptide Y receptor
MAGTFLDLVSNGSAPYPESGSYDVHKPDIDGTMVQEDPGQTQGGAGVGNQTNYGQGDTPIYAQAIIIVMYSTITILAVGGNLIVCYIVVAYQRMRTVTNIFIFNMACSDILMSVLCIPFTFVANALMLYWPFPDVMCPFVTYVQTLAVFLSAFTLVAISLDRYRAIIFPLKPRMTKQQALGTIVIIWLLSLAVPLPIAILSKTQPIDNTTDKSLCLEKWPEPGQR